MVLRWKSKIPKSKIKNNLYLKIKERREKDNERKKKKYLYWICRRNLCNNGKNEYIIIDKEDLVVVKPYYWFVQNKQAYTRIDKKTIGLGRFILNIKDSKRKVLRKNSEVLDYRKNNLFSGNTYVLKDGYYEGTCYDGKNF